MNIFSTNFQSGKDSFNILAEGHLLEFKSNNLVINDNKKTLYLYFS